MDKYLTIKGFSKKHIVIDNHQYTIYIKKQIEKSLDAPRLCVVSYQPNKKTSILLKLCIATIKKFTDIPYELWIVDNNSPLKYIKWLLDEEGINIILNRTNPKIQDPSLAGSYANAVGLEIGAALVHPNTKYFMTLHQDIAVCKEGWLTYLLSKFNENIRAVGVRKDTKRVKDGILHVLGYIIDFQLFKKLSLSFFPELPNFDVGDKAIVSLKNSGYEIFATLNTLWNKEIIDKLPQNSCFKNFNVDRSLDDDGNVIFLHLGRGVIKSKDDKNFHGRTIDDWEKFIKKNLLGNDFLLKTNIKNYNISSFQMANKFLSYSTRRYYVDEFYLKNIGIFSKGAKILDMGGKKKNKRGLFDIDKYGFEVKYANIDPKTEPDFLCDIKKIPVEDNSFDGIILSETLEHIDEPLLVLKEAYRLLKPNGKCLICVPFIFQIHADPYDFGRYTDYYYKKYLSELGFKNIKIEKQGLFFGALANMVKLWAYELDKQKKPKPYFIRKLFHKAIFWFNKKCLEWDNTEFCKTNSALSGYTTGYGIICEK